MHFPDILNYTFSLANNPGRRLGNWWFWTTRIQPKYLGFFLLVVCELLLVSEVISPKSDITAMFKIVFGGNIVVCLLLLWYQEAHQEDLGDTEVAKSLYDDILRDFPRLIEFIKVIIFLYILSLPFITICMVLGSLFQILGITLVVSPIAFILLMARYSGGSKKRIGKMVPVPTK